MQTANPGLPVYLRIAEATEQYIGDIGVPLALKTDVVDGALAVRVRLVDSAPDRIRERLIALLRDTADTIEHAGEAG